MINTQFMSLTRDIAIFFPAFVIVFTFRGFFRAFIAKMMGDDTAQRDGFMTLNPIAHVDVFGLTMILVMIFFIGLMFSGGMARAMILVAIVFMGVRWSNSVPFNSRNFKHIKRGMGLTILAYPFGSILIAFIFMYIKKYLPFGYLSASAFMSLTEICNAVIELGFLFGILELIPLPPFEGGRFLQAVLPPSKQYILSWLEQYSLFIIIGLLILPGVSEVFWGSIIVMKFLLQYGLSFLVF